MFRRSLPPPVYGISTIAERARPEGFAEAQVNMRNDVQDKLIKRPKTKFSGIRLPESQIDASAVVTEVFFRDGIRNEIVVYSDNIQDILEVFYRSGDSDFDRAELNVGSSWLFGVGDIGVNLIDGNFYIWNRNNVIGTEDVDPVDPSLYARTSMINVISALNYAEEIELRLTVGTTPETVNTVTYEVPGLTTDNQAEADAARATNTVAAAIATAVNALAGYTASSKGSNVSITTTLDGELNVELSGGRGSGTIEVLNRVLRSPEFMPLYSIPNVVRAISANPRNADGAYYLKAEPVKSNAGASEMVEVVWTETRTPEGAQKFLDTSFIVKYDTESNVLSKFKFKEQLVGDSRSNPPLDFIGERIEHIEVFQDRLAILAGSRVSFSETGDYSQVWKGSATETLVSDPTSVGTSGNSSTLKYALYHNKDLLIFADNAQFKLDGTAAITPQTAAMPRTTSNECDLSVKPVQMGASVYYAMDYGNSVGVRRFDVQANTEVDVSTSITDHIVGLIRGRITALVSNANQDLLIVRSDLCEPEQFYVFELQRIGEDQVIQSWAEWKLADGMAIDKIDIFNQVITIRYNSRYYVTCNLREAEDFPASDVHLDCYIELTGSGTSCTLPSEWDTSLGAPVALLGDEGREQLIELYTTLSGNTLDMGEDVDGLKLLVGYKFNSVYQPSRIFKRDRQGNIQTRDRLRLGSYNLELSDTYRLTRSIQSEYWDIPDEVITGNDGYTNEYIDDVKPFTGLWQTSIGMNTTDCAVAFTDDSPFKVNIVSIEYSAQLYSTTRR